jgi:hypothetical protein
MVEQQLVAMDGMLVIMMTLTIGDLQIIQLIR